MEVPKTNSFASSFCERVSTKNHFNHCRSDEDRERKTEVKVIWAALDEVIAKNE